MFCQVTKLINLQVLLVQADCFLRGRYNMELTPNERRRVGDFSMRADEIPLGLGGAHTINDMKLAHYMHIAPRLLFVAQGLATLIGAIVQCGVTPQMRDEE
jgi:membrane protein YdbS with pleckstrin-like domain